MDAVLIILILYHQNVNEGGNVDKDEDKDEDKDVCNIMV